MKGIAIPYIIAIILGIAVVAVIGASFFGTTGNLTTKDCQNKLATFCTVWRLSGYSGSGPNDGWEAYSPECSKLGVSLKISRSDTTGCDTVLGRTTTTETPSVRGATTGGKERGANCDPAIRNDCGGTLTCDALLKICK